MSLATDIAGDYALMDGLETVTLVPKGRLIGSVPNVNALKRQLTKADLQQIGDGIALGSQWTVWHLWGIASSVNPSIGDQIKTSAELWIVKSLTYSPQTSRWRCICEKAAGT